MWDAFLRSKAGGFGTGGDEIVLSGAEEGGGGEPRTALLLPMECEVWRLAVELNEGFEA